MARLTVVPNNHEPSVRKWFTRSPWPNENRPPSDPDAPVFITEGEKDCDAVWGLKLIATCVAGGIWTPEIAAVLKGRDIIYLEDNDQAGREKSARAVQALTGIARTIRIADFADLPEGSDVSDWIVIDPEKHNADANAIAVPTAGASIDFLGPLIHVNFLPRVSSIGDV